MKKTFLTYAVTLTGLILTASMANALTIDINFDGDSNSFNKGDFNVNAFSGHIQFNTDNVTKGSAGHFYNIITDIDLILTDTNEEVTTVGMGSGGATTNRLIQTQAGTSASDVFLFAYAGDFTDDNDAGDVVSIAGDMRWNSAYDMFYNVTDLFGALQAGDSFSGDVGGTNPVSYFNFNISYGSGSAVTILNSGDFDNLTVVVSDNVPTPTPEPASMLLLGSGLAGIAGIRLRKKTR